MIRERGEKVGNLLSDGRRKYYSVKEVADYLGISRSTAYEIIGAGNLPAKKFGGSVKVSREAILAYEASSDYRMGA